jgi:hypothetical protein
MQRPSHEDNWHLDRRVPVALIFAILTQGAVGIWWVSNIGAQVQEHEKRLTKFEEASARETQLLSSVNERLARIEEAILNLKAEVLRGK